MLSSLLMEGLLTVFYLIFAAISVLVILMTIFHDQVSRYVSAHFATLALATCILILS